MHKHYSFAVNSLPAAGGVACAMQSMLAEQFKPAAVGLVLDFGTGVLATLDLRIRRASNESSRLEGCSSNRTSHQDFHVEESTVREPKSSRRPTA